MDDEDGSSDSGVEGEEGGAAAPPLPPQPAPRQSTQPDPPPTTAPPAAEHRAAPVAPAYGSGERQRPKTAPARTAAHSALATIRMQKDLAKKQRREERDKSERARQNELERVKAMTMHDMLESVAIGGSGRKKKLLFLTGEQADQIVQSSTSIDAMLRAFEVGAPRHASSHPPPPLTFSPAIHLPTLSTSLLHPLPSLSPPPQPLPPPSGGHPSARHQPARVRRIWRLDTSAHQGGMERPQREVGTRGKGQR